VQRFVQLLPGGTGVIYCIQAEGGLVRYRNARRQTGSSGWANGGAGVQLGSGRRQFRTVLASENGLPFGFMADGTVRWYKYVIANPDTGAGYWAGGGNGPVIGGGFDKYPRLFGGWDNVIYGVDDNGDMWWSQYAAEDGTGGAKAWANNGVPARIGSGWK
jgi:tachylectin